MARLDLTRHLRVWIHGLTADRFGRTYLHFCVFTCYLIMALDWDDDVVLSGMKTLNGGD